MGHFLSHVRSCEFMLSLLFKQDRCMQSLSFYNFQIWAKLIGSESRVLSWGDLDIYLSLAKWRNLVVIPWGTWIGEICMDVWSRTDSCHTTSKSRHTVTLQLLTHANLRQFYVQFHSVMCNTPSRRWVWSTDQCNGYRLYSPQHYCFVLSYDCTIHVGNVMS